MVVLNHSMILKRCVLQTWFCSRTATQWPFQQQSAACHEHYLSGNMGVAKYDTTALMFRLYKQPIRDDVHIREPMSAGPATSQCWETLKEHGMYTDIQ